MWAMAKLVAWVRRTPAVERSEDRRRNVTKTVENKEMRSEAETVSLWPGGLSYIVYQDFKTSGWGFEKTSPNANWGIIVYMKSWSFNQVPRRPRHPWNDPFKFCLASQSWQLLASGSSLTSCPHRGINMAEVFTLIASVFEVNTET